MADEEPDPTLKALFDASNAASDATVGDDGAAQVKRAVDKALGDQENS